MAEEVVKKGTELVTGQNSGFSSWFLLTAVCILVSVVVSFLSVRFFTPQKPVYVFDLTKAISVWKGDPAMLKAKMTIAQKILNSYDGPVLLKSVVLNHNYKVVEDVTNEVIKEVNDSFKTR